MKESYVTYEQAVKLKELGFSEPCDSYYYDDKLMHYDPQDVLNRNTNGWGRPRKCSAPRLDQVQKWLREVKGIHVEPCFIYESAFDFIIKSERLNLCKIMEERFDTYELTLSAGIDAALRILTTNK